jgi:hypothetical protein
VRRGWGRYKGEGVVVRESECGMRDGKGNGKGESKGRRERVS